MSIKEVSSFSSHILKELKEFSQRKIFVADIYERLGGLHRCPKKIIRSHLIELNHAGKIKLNFHSPEGAFLKIKQGGKSK